MANSYNCRVLMGGSELFLASPYSFGSAEPEDSEVEILNQRVREGRYKI